MGIKQITCLALSALLCLSLAGCGKDESVVDDYGTDDVEVAVDTEGGSPTDGSPTDSSVMESVSVSNETDTTLKDFFGEGVSFTEDRTIDGHTINADAYFEVPDQNHLNAYNMKKIDDGKADEETIVKNFFGDSAEKLESVKYENATDYITLMYKYDYIKRAYDNSVLAKEKGAYYQLTQAYDGMIDSSTQDLYGWLDNEDLYIHMYEGDYEGKKFVMLLAYNYISGTRYIFIEPKSIKEYFPDYDFKTLVVSGSTDTASNPLSLDNKCDKEPEELKGEAQKFLDNVLHLNEKYNPDAAPYDYSEACARTGILFYASAVNMATAQYNDGFDPGYSVLNFSTVDYISTIRAAGIQGFASDYRLLSEQRNILSEHLASHDGSKYTDYDLLSSTVVDDYIDPPQTDIDGYAFFIGDNDTSLDGLNVLDNPNTVKVESGNTGIIKYTSNGFYGLDITLSKEIVDTVENVRLLEFDKISESFWNGIEEQADFSKINNSKEVQMFDMEMTYFPYSESEDSDTYMMIPVWSFNCTTLTPGIGMTVSINAMDGSVVDIFYYDYFEMYEE